MNTTENHNNIWLSSYDREVNQHLVYPKTPLYTFLEDSAQRFTEKTCTLFKGKDISYNAIWQYSRNFSAHLIQLGCKKGDRIGLAVSNSPSFVIAFYGILLAGGVVAAINPLYKESEITFMLENAGVEIVIGQTENAAVIEKVKSQTKLRVAIITDILDDAEELAKKQVLAAEATSQQSSVQPGQLITMPFLSLVNPVKGAFEYPTIDANQDAAVFQYSGGTTGIPKAAIGLHRNLAANTVQFRNWLWSLRDGSEIVLAAIPLYHVYGMVIALNVGVMLGATLLLKEDARDIQSLLEDVTKYRPGLFPCVPNLFFGMIQKFKASEGIYDISSLKVNISGSAPLMPAIKEEFERLSGGKVLEGYGLSEAPTATHCNPLGGKNKAGSIGLPLPDVDCKLIPYLDSMHLQDDEMTGELLIRGPQVMAGYHNARDEDREIIKDGWLHTGDIARMDENGYFYILGRKKELIKIGGLQVWPSEVEEVIGKHPAVKEVCVAGVPGPEKSEIVKAWVVLKQGQLVQAEEIRQWVRDRLVHYKAPGLVEFRDNLPRTPVGKPLRRELVREYNENQNQ